MPYWLAPLLGCLLLAVLFTFPAYCLGVWQGRRLEKLERPRLAEVRPLRRAS